MIRGLGRQIVAFALLLAAASVFAPGSASAASGIEIANTGATSDFPNGMTFTLSATAPAPIETIQLLYRLASDATLSLQSPSFQPATEVTTSVTTDFRINYVPAGIDVTYHWRIIDQRGATLESEPVVVKWSDSRFDWTEFKSSDVSVFTYTGNDAFANRILNSAQSAVDTLEPRYGIAAIDPVRLWVYNSSDDFRATQQPNSQEFVAATTYPQFHVILAVLPEGGLREVDRVVPHEISHQVLAQAVANPFATPPLWLDEGLALSAQLRGTEDMQAQVQTAADEGRLDTVRSLNSEFPLERAGFVFGYAESYSIVQFILDRWGWDGMTKLLDGYRDQLSHDAAAQRALGVDLDGLDRLWKESLGYRGDTPGATTTSHNADTPWTELWGNVLAIVLMGAVTTSLAVGFIRRRRQHAASDSHFLASVPGFHRLRW